MLVDLTPFERHVHVSTLPPLEVMQRLQEHVRPVPTFSLRLLSSKAEKSYEGSVSGNTFSIQRVIGYRNSFLPWITGTIHAAENGSLIQVRMRPRVFVLVFMSIWMGIIGLVFLSGVITLINGHRQMVGMVAIASLMLLFGYGLTMLAFKYESGRSRKELEKLLSGTLLPRMSKM